MLAAGKGNLELSLAVYLINDILKRCVYSEVVNSDIFQKVFFITFTSIMF